MKWRLVIGLLALMFVFAAPASVLAQNYSFSLDNETVNVYWNKDGSMDIDYVLAFSNNAGASAIDYIDIGLPNSSYSLSKIKADVDGKAITDIQKGDPKYVAVGVTLGLGSAAIQPGQKGTVHVSVTGLKHVLYPDDSDAAYASAVFSPNWFDSAVVHGSTNVTVIFHLPPGIQPDEPRYHKADAPFPSAPQTALDDTGRVMYTWNSAKADGHTQYFLGASFPAKYVAASAIERATPTPIASTASGSTDIVDSILGVLCNPVCCVAGFWAFGILSPILNWWNNRRRKLQYLPPKISIEGHGIKRGLTAVEAAVLMELPMDKVMTMILFAVIKKGAARVTDRNPLQLWVNKPIPDGLQEYERDFLQAFIVTLPKARQMALQDMMIKLIKSLSEKMKGFSRKESVAYYQSIIQQAWQQVQAAQTPEVKSQKFDQVMDWTMLDRDFDSRTRETFGTGPVFVPMWWGHYAPVTSAPMSAGMPSAPLSMPALPGADFAASLVNGVQDFSSSVIGNVSDFTSRITQQTNPPPVSTSSGYRGGGGCACACACAGCACACAGGGR